MNCAIIIAEGVYKSSIHPRGPDRLIIKYTINPAHTGGIDVNEPRKLTKNFLRKKWLVPIKYPRNIEIKNANKVETKLTCKDIVMASTIFDISIIITG